jgi:hypothetical protein
MRKPKTSAVTFIGIAVISVVVGTLAVGCQGSPSTPEAPTVSEKSSETKTTTTTNNAPDSGGSTTTTEKSTTTKSNN